MTPENSSPEELTALPIEARQQIIKTLLAHAAQDDKEIIKIGWAITGVFEELEDQDHQLSIFVSTLSTVLAWLCAKLGMTQEEFVATQSSHQDVFAENNVLRALVDILDSTETQH